MSHIFAITPSGDTKAAAPTQAFTAPAKNTFRRLMMIGGLLLLVTFITGCPGGKVAVNNELPPAPTPAPNLAGVWLENDVSEISPISRCEIQQTPNFFIVNLWTRDRGASSETALGTFRGALRPDGTAEAEGTFSQPGASASYLEIDLRSLSADELLIQLTIYERKNAADGPPSVEISQLLKR